MNWIIFGLALWAVSQVPVGLMVGHCLQRPSVRKRDAIRQSDAMEVVRPTHFLAAHKLPPRRARRRDMAQSFSLRFVPVTAMRHDTIPSRAHR